MRQVFFSHLTDPNHKASESLMHQFLGVMGLRRLRGAEVEGLWCEGFTELAGQRKGGEKEDRDKAPNFGM